MRKNIVISIWGMFILFGFVSLYVYANKVDKQVLSLKDVMQLAKNGKYNEAIEEIKQIIKQKPDKENVEAHLGLGLIYYKIKQYENALDEFVKTAEIKRNSPMAYYFMGLIYEKKAISEIDKMTAKDMKRKALKAWQNYLGCDHKKEMKEAHRNIGITVKESIKRAKRHIKMLQEDLDNE